MNFYFILINYLIILFFSNAEKIKINFDMQFKCVNGPRPDGRLIFRVRQGEVLKSARVII